jgi:hypothetical protein
MESSSAPVTIGFKPARMCRKCGQPIPEKRLKARPNTHLCIDCQSQQDTILTVAPVNLASLNTLRGGDGYTAPVSYQDFQMGRLESRGFLSTTGLSSAMETA